VLLGNTRMHHIAFVNRAYSAEVDRRTGVVKAQVTSASALSSEEQSTLTSKLETMTGKQVIVEFGTDADLIGGVVTRIGSRIYDGSVRAKLDAYKRQMTGQVRA
ncbi:MAG: ATP synthase F1 subunit delta, partial [Blastocatellia bacterium]